jgi:SAM-dependent methyltransferase
MAEEPTDVDLYGKQYGNFATRLYEQIRIATYGDEIGQNGWLTASEHDLFIDWLGAEGRGAGFRVLDVACGSGGPTLRIAEKAGCSVDGVDIHDQAIARAREAAAARGLASRARFHLADASGALPFDEGTFDAVICIDAINHLRDRVAILREWYRVLKPGGTLVFTDPIVVTGPLTDREIAVRASIGFFLFVPDGYDDAVLGEVGFRIEHRLDCTENMADMAARFRDARAERESSLLDVEGEPAYLGQQSFFDVTARLARERRLSRIAYVARKP